MNLDRFTGPGSTPARRRFWDKVQSAVMASRKVEGRHVKIDEHIGAGSVINVDDTSTRRPTGGSGGACCYDDGTCDDLIESECTDAGGNWQGPGTTCDDDPPPCVGVCCEDSGCVDDSTPDSCAADGGTWTDFGTNCADDPPPCEMPPCSGCGFDAFDESGRKFHTRTTVLHYTQISDCCEPESGCFQCAVDGTQTTTEAYDIDCNYTSVTDPISSLFPETGGCPDRCDGHFLDITLAPGCDVLTTISATEQSCTYGTTFDCDTCSNPEGGTDTVKTVTVTLSNECDPEGFSPPP